MSHDLTCDLYVKSCQFERKHGSVAFLKACSSALNRLLVQKGIVTIGDLGLAMHTELI